MVDKLNNRLERHTKPSSSGINNPTGATVVSDAQMFMNMGPRVIWKQEVENVD